MMKARVLAIIFLLALILGCTGAPTARPPDATKVARVVETTLAAHPMPTFTLAPLMPGGAPRTTPTAAPTPLPTTTATSIPLPQRFEPAGCLRPPDDTTTVEINGWTINARTLAMLQQAQSLYGGEIDLTGTAVTQGSYHDNGSASFGTHLGGGAVDLAIFLPGTWTVDFPQLQRMVRALRAAGFAAWVRNIDEVFPGSGYHIHAIAVADPQLSQAAEEQLTGKYGYFYGWNGLPKPDGVPVADREGGPILCGWMIEAGYSDLSAGVDLPPAAPPYDWPERLRAAAEQMQTANQAESVALARGLYYVDGQSEQPDTLDGPLAGALWAKAGLLPAGLHPARTLANYRPRAERMDALAASLPGEDYERIRATLIDGALDADWQPLPGDLVELRGATGSKMVVITGVDPDGRAYTVTPVQQADGEWRVEQALFYDPGDPQSSLRDVEVLDVLRYRWGGLPQSRPLQYSVHAGDTLPGLAERFGLNMEEIVAANAGINAAQLGVGEIVVIP